MNISIANIVAPPAPPPPPPTQAPPPSTDSTNSSDNSSFSQQLSRAKAKPAAGGNQQTQQPQANATQSNSNAKKADDSKTTQDKGQSKQQQKQTNQSSTASNAETDAQAAEQLAQTDQGDQANVADQAQKKPTVAQPVLTYALPVQTKTTTSTKDAKGDATKSANADANQTADASANLTTLQTVLASQQQPQQTAPAAEKPATTDAANREQNTDVLKAETPAKPMVSPFKAQDDAAGQKNAQSAQDAGQAADQAPVKTKTVDAGSDSATFAQVLEQQTAAQTPAPASGVQHAAAQAAPQPPQTPVAQFAEANQPAIVSTIRGSLLPDGGTMNISLNPPDLGAMQISVRMENGVMSASFQTSNEQATRLLTHTLGQLKNALEIQGVNVDRLHVHQASSSEGSSNQNGDSENSGRQSSQDGRSAQQEEQRRETLRRMWRRVRGGRDPLDLVA